MTMPRPKWLAGWMISLLVPGAAGCPSLEALPDEASVVEMTTPATEQPYLLYVPSTYDKGRAWPLVVLCHGTWPYDTAELQMREWARYAEQQGIIVVAPTLRGTRGDLPPSPQDQIALQRADEKVILEVVSTIGRQYNVAEHQVFMAGWSAGAYVMLHTGLRHPDVFRAVYLRQPSFDARFLDLPEHCIDDWQAVKVVYGQGDVITREQSRACIAWLREQGYFVEEMEFPGSHRRLAALEAWKYFKEVARRRVWARVRTSVPDTSRPLAVRFSVDALPAVSKCKWSFGDGETSNEAAPVHSFAQGGRYPVTVDVTLENGKTYTRRRTVGVGSGK